jgi:hypothetical protein
VSANAGRQWRLGDERALTECNATSQFDPTRKFWPDQHLAVATGSDKSSPSVCAMSAIDLSIMTVDTGNSTGSAAKPNVPPAAPDAIARARCNNSDPARGDRGRVRNATLRAASSPFVVADAIAFEANEGRAYPISSTGLPTRLVSRAARPGCSSDLIAFARASRSAGCHRLRGKSTQMTVRPEGANYQ